jgi:hypothetical protein
MSSHLNSIRATDHAPLKLRGESSAFKQPTWLSEAVRLSLHATRGTLKLAADAIGCSYARAAALADPTQRLAVKAYEIPGIVAASGRLDVLQALARECGCIVVALPSIVNPAHADVVAHAAVVMKETADVLTSVGASLADGHFTRTERQHVKDQIIEAHASLAALDLIVDRTEAA